MKKSALIFSLLVIHAATFAQYYLRGEVKDEKNTPLSNAKIRLHSSGYIYYSGQAGAFGITTSKKIDSVTINMDGYHPVSLQVDAGKYQSIILKMLYASADIRKNRLLSFTKNLRPEDRENWSASGETYSSQLENEFVNSRKYPETGFAIHTDKAAYSNIRRFLNMGTTIPSDAVRVEELLNYFNFSYTAPKTDSVFAFESYVSDCPWNPNNQLLFLNICAKKIEPEKIPPSNLVFLIDVSGSMDMPNRLPLLKSAFKLLVDNLRDSDTISIVVYGSTTGVWLIPTSGKEKEKIRKAIEELNPVGATPGESGIRAAYRVAKSQFIPHGNNRVILATDGDFNVGQSTEDELEKLITQHQQSGIYLTCLGVGMGNYKDSKLEVLAKKGNGNFAYLDNEKEAEKVLVKELTQTLYTVADDAYLNIQFNADLVNEYRLIGYDNKLKALADTLSEVEGGEVGSGLSLIVLFELVPQFARLESGYHKDELAKVMVHYRKPSDSTHRIAYYNCTSTITDFSDLPRCHQFAASVTMFASLLKESKYSKRYSWNDAIILAHQAHDPKDPLQTEFVGMIEKAKRIYLKNRKKPR
ncbi:MAG: von Willebrand factor type A domain-containing protein [Chitinophagaceae bacterium]|nr:von Willebrand factor type A domain-containing protein [Chitinophagaceae bacterium]